MPSLLIKNIPPRLHAKLKQRAAGNRRSLNGEAIHVLEAAVGHRPPEDSASAGAVGTPLDESALAALPPDIAERLRAMRELRESLAARKMDFAAWRKSVRDARR
jgi:plasmid stability protein